eukprot:TRINITY_DN49331_c0_g1_i1.p1 TRINITY_DN49331_c0_g1~~TRINITY_DN49331_c0_g1_i1.p1  ORF type:complete len:922 (+),score=212.98 TRINITY_DN49331_c0_g1_i1:339-3104(+)
MIDRRARASFLISANASLSPPSPIRQSPGTNTFCSSTSDRLEWAASEDVEGGGISRSMGGSLADSFRSATGYGNGEASDASASSSRLFGRASPVARRQHGWERSGERSMGEPLSGGHPLSSSMDGFVTPLPVWLPAPRSLPEVDSLDPRSSPAQLHSWSSIQLRNSDCSEAATFWNEHSCGQLAHSSSSPEFRLLGRTMRPQRFAALAAGGGCGGGGGGGGFAGSSPQHPSRSRVRSGSTRAVAKAAGKRNVAEFQRQLYAIRRSGWQDEPPTVPPQLAKGIHPWDEPWRDIRNTRFLQTSETNWPTWPKPGGMDPEALAEAAGKKVNKKEALAKKAAAQKAAAAAALAAAVGSASAKEDAAADAPAEERDLTDPAASAPPPGDGNTEDFEDELPVPEWAAEKPVPTEDAKIYGPYSGIVKSIDPVKDVGVLDSEKALKKFLKPISFKKKDLGGLEVFEGDTLGFWIERAEDGPPKPRAITVIAREDQELHTLMLVTLADPQDTEEQLQKRLRVLRQSEKSVEDVGGVRHPSALVAARTALVVQEKFKRLEAVRLRVEAFDRVVAERKAMIQAVLEGSDPLTHGKEAFLYRNFVAGCVHEGDPREDERGNFEIFAKTFGLPANHTVVTVAQRKLTEGVRQWGEDALHLADVATDLLLRPPPNEEGFIPEIVEEQPHKLATYLDNLCVLLWNAGNLDVELKKKDVIVQRIKGFKKGMIQLEKDLRSRRLERYAENLRQETQKEVEQDERIAESAGPEVGGKAAMKASERLTGVVKQTVERGVNPGNPIVFEAKKAALELRAEAVRRNALALLYEDEVTFKAQGWIAGKATELADKIDAEVMAASDAGIDFGHPKVKEARKSAKELREQEGFRKREATAAKKRAEKQAAEEAERKRKEHEEKAAAELERRKKMKEQLGPMALV